MSWRVTLNANPRVSQNLSLSKFQSIILQDKKGCIAIRDVFQNTNIEPGWVVKRNQIITEDINLGDWEAYNKNLTSTKLSVNYQYFQYQIITRTIITKKTTVSIQNHS